jgi:predicted metal-dependent hydrolase
MTIQIDEMIFSKRRTIELRITTDGKLVVRAPKRASREFIERAVAKKEAWILRKLQSIKRVEPKQYIAGEQFPFLGKLYNLRLTDDIGKKLSLVDEFVLNSSLAGQAKILLQRWYRKEAKKIIPERVQNFAEQYGFIYRKITITSAQKRWGSCTSRGSVNFSWRLIMAPQEVIDYVIVHELSHLTHLNHSKQFWHKVQTIMPNFKEQRQWLKANGPLLNL